MNDEADLRTRAEEGDREAQFALGKMYQMGEASDAPVDLWDRYDVAKAWFERAAKQGHREARCRIAGLRDGWELDNPIARKWYQAAAESGHPEACMAISAYHFDHGDGEATGVKWYRRARELGHPHDPVTLGIRAPFFGSGWACRPGRAERRFKKTAISGDRRSQYHLGALYMNGAYGTVESVIDAYAWFSMAANYKPDSPTRPRKSLSHYSGWGTAERAVRLLELVFTDEERAAAHAAARELNEQLVERQTSAARTRFIDWLYGKVEI